MSQIKDMYNMVRIVREMADELEKTRAKLPKRESLIHALNNGNPRISEVKEKYITKYSCSRTKADAAYSDAVNNKYLKESDKKFGRYSLPFFARVTTEGRTLINKDFGLPTGRWNAWLAQNSNLTNFVSGSLAATLLGFVIWLGKLIFEHVT